MVRFRHKHTRVNRVQKATVVAGRPGRHVLLEICGGRVMCLPRAEADVELGRMGYCAPGDRRDGEPVQIRLLSSVWRLVGSLRLVFADHLASESDGLSIVRLCERCRGVIVKAGRLVPA